MRCMADEVTSSTETPGASVISVPPAQTDASTPEVKADASSASVGGDLLSDFRAEEAKLKGEPEPKKEEVKPKAETSDEDDDEAEPEGLSEADKKRAAWNKKVRDDALRASSEAATRQKELDAREAALAAKESEIAGKIQKTDETTKGEVKPGQSVEPTLEHYKPVTLELYDGEQNPNEAKIVAGMEGLAKDVQKVLTVIASRDAEIERLKSDNERLMKLAEPHLPDADGNTPAMIAEVANTVTSNVAKAVETLQGQYGPDSGLTIDPVTMLAAFREYAQGFNQIGEIKNESFFSPESFIRCYEHAYRNEIATARASGGAKQEEKPKAPPLGEGGGKAARPVSEEGLSPGESMLLDYKKEVAASNGRR